MPNLLVTGANGQLALEIKDLADDRFIFKTKEQLDICEYEAVDSFCKKNDISVIINCASYTAVDQAEEEKELCDKINHVAVKNLAEIAKKRDIKLVHISTDYVFDGKSYKPYLEDDQTRPINFYGMSKLKGEEAIKEIAPKNSAIIRTSWIYSRYGKNFVKKIIQLSQTNSMLNVVFDQIGTPTYAKDLARVILNMAQTLKCDKPKVYHYSNEGVCSWYDFAYEIIKLKGYECKILPIHSYEYPTPAKRPHISMLDKTKIKNEFCIEIPYWRDSLEKMLKEID